MKQDMKNLTINTASELKKLLKSNRKSIVSINDLKIGELYPMLEVSNRYAYYYNVNSQNNVYLRPPFNVILK